MKQASSIGGTFKTTWTTYYGDGHGRDHYITFNNGGLSTLRDYPAPQHNGFNLGPQPANHGVNPAKEPTVFDYKPDGSGRDLYVINSFGLKRNYRSNFRDFEKLLRTDQSTPQMDKRQIHRRDSADASVYTNWPSQRQSAEKRRLSKAQRESMQRLTGSPNRVSPMMQYIKGTATFSIDPKSKAQNYLPAHANELKLKQSSRLLHTVRTTVERNRSVKVKSANPSAHIHEYLNEPIATIPTEKSKQD